MRMPREEEPAMKTFSPANKNVPRLESYEEDLGDAYWEKGRCQEWLGVHEGWGFLSTLGTLNTPLRRSVGVKRALVHFCRTEN